MASLIWSAEALRDIDEIATFIARDSPDQAALFVARLIEATDRLVDHPRSGRVIPELESEDCREVIVAPYRIMYQIDHDQVLIVRVQHGARNWPGT